MSFFEVRREIYAKGGMNKIYVQANDCGLLRIGYGPVVMIDLPTEQARLVAKAIIELCDEMESSSD